MATPGIESTKLRTSQWDTDGQKSPLQPEQRRRKPDGLLIHQGSAIRRYAAGVYTSRALRQCATEVPKRVPTRRCAEDDGLGFTTPAVHLKQG
jgi:hypothetical protein